MTLATKYEAAKRELAIVEDQIMDKFESIGLTLGNWEEFHYDPHDGELVITGCAGLSEDQMTALREEGFSPRTTIAK